MSHSASQIVGHDLQTEMCGRMAAMPGRAALTGPRLGLTAWSKVSWKKLESFFACSLSFFPSWPLTPRPAGIRFLLGV